MIILDSTTRSLSLDGTLIGSKVVVSYTDMTATTFTPATQLSTITVSGTILSAPSLGIKRVVNFISIYNSDNPAPMKVIYNDGATPYTIFQANINTGEFLEYTEQDSWKVVTKSGIKKSETIATNYKGSSFYKGYKDAQNLTDVTAAVSVNAPLIVYMGKYSGNGITYKAQYRVTTLTSSITYAELALYYSPVLPNPSEVNSTVAVFNSIPLTRQAWTNCASIWNSTGIKTTTIGTGITLGIPVGSHLFLTFNGSAGVAAIFRGALADDTCSGISLDSNGTGWRPSTGAPPNIYVTSTNTTVPPWVVGSFT